MSNETNLSTTDAGLILEIKERFQAAQQATIDWRRDAREDYDMYAGSQWSKDDIEKLKKQLRPVVSFNRIHPVIETITGLEISNRQEIRYYPRTTGAAQVNEMLTGAAQWVRDECNAEDEESEAFRDMTISGMGWTNSHLTYDDDPDGKIVIHRVDPLVKYWDPNTQKQNLIDRLWDITVTDVHKTWLEAQWPDKKDELNFNTMWAAGPIDSLTDVVDRSRPGEAYQQPTNVEGQGIYGKEGYYRLIEYQWKEFEPYYRVIDPETSELKEIDADTFLKVQDRATQLGLVLDFVPQKRVKVYRAFVSGHVVFEVGPSPVKDQFTYQCMTAYRDRNSGTFYGVVRPMKDPQRWANKWLAQSMHIINSNSKGGVYAEKDAFDNQRKAEEEYAKPDAITWLRSGGLGKVKEKQPPTYPQGTNDLMQFAVQSIRDVTGVNVEMLGMADREQPAMLEFQRKQSAVTILSTLFDSLRRYRKEQGKLLLSFIQEYISDDRMIRIQGQNGAEYVNLAKDQVTGKYDVIIDDAPTSPNEKQRIWELLVQVLPILPTIGLPLIPELLDYVPLPASLVQTWKAYLEQMNQPNPLKQATEQAQMQMIAAMAAQAQADAQKSSAQAQDAFADAQLKTAQAQKLNPQVEAIKAMADMTTAKAQANKMMAEAFQMMQGDPVKQAQAQKEMAAAFKLYQEASAVVPQEINAQPVLADAEHKRANAQSSLIKAQSDAQSKKLKSFSDMAQAMRETDIKQQQANNPPTQN